MKLISYLFALLVTISFSIQANIVVFTTHQYPVQMLDNIQVFYIDDDERYNDELFGRLSSDPVLAEKQAKAILNSLNWQEYEQQIIEHSRGMFKAWELKLQKIPAIVFEDKYVVYGTTDIKYAEKQLRKYLDENQ